MVEARDQKAQELFEAALSRPPRERPPFLDEACRGDAALRAEIEALLHDHAEATTGFMAPPKLDVARGAAPTPPPDPMIGKKIGHFHINSFLSSGGMGRVYLAQQEHPRRTVALKIMRPNVPSETALRRFEHESQILALLRHPAIAQVYDAGIHDEGDGGDGGGGMPYFAMEYIPNARAITDYADDKRLTVKERLDLFVQVCDAVHQGHQRGVIHRDLKPENIIVDSSGQPKIIDFGVARSTDSDMAVTTLQADPRQLVGTLQYMSPEQCDADPTDIDPRSDVYSLGVVLYELLCGRPPYDVLSLSVSDAVRIIRERRPARPGTLYRALRGDLEAIALRALEKQRDRRYQSARDLSDDIRRLFANQPITARPPSAIYLLSKFLRRNRVATIASAVVLATFGIGVVFTSWGLMGGVVAVLAVMGLGTLAVSWAAIAAVRSKAEAVRLREVAEQERDRAAAAQEEASSQREQAVEATERAETQLRETERQARIATNTLSFLEGLFASINPFSAHASSGASVRVKLIDVLHMATETVLDRFADEPLTEASIRRLLGLTYLDLGEYQAAKMHLIKAYDLRRLHLGNEHPDTVAAMAAVAQLHYYQGRYQEAERLFADVYEIRRRALGEEHTDTLTSQVDLAQLYYWQGRYGEAESLFDSAYRLRASTSGDEHRDTLTCHGNLARVYMAQGRYDEAAAVYGNTLSGYRRVLGDIHPYTLWAMNELAALNRLTGRYDEAERLCKQSLEGRKRVLGEEHPDTLRSLDNLAVLYATRREPDRAEPLHKRALEVARSVLGARHPHTLRYVRNYAETLDALGRTEEAGSLLHDALRDERELLGEGHPDTLSTLHQYAVVLTRFGESARAVELLTKVVGAQRDTLGETNAETLASMRDLAVILQIDGRMPEAETLARRVLTARIELWGIAHPGSVDAACVISATLRLRGNPTEAKELLTSTLDSLRESRRHLPSEIAMCQFQLARVERDCGDLERAKELVLECIEIWRKDEPVRSGRIACAEHLLGSWLSEEGCFREAEDHLLRSWPDMDVRYRGTYGDYGSALSARTSCIQSLVALYEAWDKPEKTDEWRAKLSSVDTVQRPKAQG